MKRHRLVKNIVLFAVLCSVCSVFSVDASSFSVASDQQRLANGYYWTNIPRTVQFFSNMNDELTNASGSISAAMNTWNAVRDLNGNTIVTFTRVDTSSSNNIYFTSELEPGVLAYMYPYRQTAGPISQVDIKVNREYDWSVNGAGDAYDFQSVILHELGHALGVAHCHEAVNGQVCSHPTCLTNVMHYSIDRNQTRRSLTAYDSSSYILIYRNN